MNDCIHSDQGKQNEWICIINWSFSSWSQSKKIKPKKVLVTYCCVQKAGHSPCLRLLTIYNMDPAGFPICIDPYAPIWPQWRPMSSARCKTTCGDQPPGCIGWGIVFPLWWEFLTLQFFIYPEAASKAKLSRTAATKMNIPKIWGQSIRSKCFLSKVWNALLLFSLNFFFTCFILN